MKYSHIALAAALSSFGLMACSDDSSNGSNALDPLNPPTGEIPSVGENPSVGDIPSTGDPTVDNPIGGVQGGVQGEDTSAVIPPIIVEDPDEEIPTVENESVASLSLSLKGVAEVGPFASGAKVTLVGVDAATLAAQGSEIQATTSNDLGSFSLQGTIPSAYASVTAEGKFYNYVFGEVDGPITLKALSNVNNRTSLNVNVLTRLEYDRVSYLIQNEGMTFSDAKRKAEKEVRVALGLYADSTLFEDISIYGEGVATANLLAITSVMLGERSGAEVGKLVDAIATDFAADGKWNDEAAKAVLADEAFMTNVNMYYNELMNRAGVSTVESFTSVFNSFWATQYGLGPCNAATDGTLGVNTNTFSERQGNSYKCISNSWMELTAAQLQSIALEATFGVCTTAKEGAVNEAAGAYYVCKKGFWVTASANEAANKVVTEAKGPCTTANQGKLEAIDGQYYMCNGSSWVVTKHKPVDYSKGRAMNKKLGKGINFGNSWDSQGNNDCGWSNCISDGDFATAKAAGFNSVRIPVRWHHDAGGTSVSSSRLAGVKEDIKLAINAGLVVIVNFHHYTDMNEAGNESQSAFKNEMKKFLALWAQVAKEMDQFPDDKLVLEIFNEPTISNATYVDELMNEGYKVIRQNAPGKTIMFEAYHAAKFYDLDKLNLPEDGNIIYSGHYYEPFTFSHQGHGYDCKGDAAYASTADRDMKQYAAQALELYPDINGGHIPLNMGEFGIAGQCGVSDSKRAQWTKLAVQAAEAHDISWNYWCFKNCGGFEAWGGGWKTGFLDAFGL